MRWYVSFLYCSIPKCIYILFSPCLVWFSCTFRLLTRKTGRCVLPFCRVLVFMSRVEAVVFSCRCRTRSRVEASRNGWQAYSNHPLSRVLVFVILILSNIMVIVGYVLSCPAYSVCTAVGVTNGRRLKFRFSRLS